MITAIIVVLLLLFVFLLTVVVPVMSIRQSVKASIYNTTLSCNDIGALIRHAPSGPDRTEAAAHLAVAQAHVRDATAANNAGDRQLARHHLDEAYKELHAARILVAPDQPDD